MRISDWSSDVCSSDLVSSRNIQSRHIVTKARIHHQFDPLPVQRDGRQIAHGRKGGATLLAIGQFGGKSLIHRRGRANEKMVFGNITEQQIAFVDEMTKIPHAARKRGGEGKGGRESGE